MSDYIERPPRLFYDEEEELDGSGVKRKVKHFYVKDKGKMTKVKGKKSIKKKKIKKKKTNPSARADINEYLSRIHRE